MNSPFLTTDLLKEYLKTELGDGRVMVELLDKHFQSAVQDAVDVMNRYLPGTRQRTLGGSTGDIKRYRLDLTQMPGFIDVIDCQFIRPELTGGVGLSENPFVLEHHVMHDMGHGYGDYAMVMAGMKDSRRVFSTAPQWEGHWELDMTDPNDPQRIFNLYLDLPDGMSYAPYEVSYIYAFAYSADDNKATGIPSLPPNKHQWFRKFALARSKLMLGRIRGKFIGIPGVDDGSTFEIDAQTLIDEAREEERELLEDLFQQQRQVPVILG